MALEVVGVNAWYGKTQALWDVSVSVAPGECVVLLGLNGAGKSTLLRAISGVMVRADGSIKFEGRSIRGDAAWKRSSLGIAHVPERRHIFPSLTVDENLRIGYAGRGGTLGELRAEAYEVFPDLTSRMSHLAGQLSGGQQQMLAIGRALMSSPSLLMMDEPLLGLAPVLVDKLLGALQRLSSGTRSFLIAEERPEIASVLADRICMVANGALLREGSAGVMLESYARDGLLQMASGEDR